MKTSQRCVITLLGFCAGLAPALQAQAEPTPAKPELKEKREMRVIVDRQGRPGALLEKEPVTFLGVETSRAGGALASQLGLPQGTGLVVTAIVPGSPAAGPLQRHDLLTKLNDQLLVDAGQLGVLVRTFKEGDEVTLTFLRAGKETTARVKLGKREAPKMSSLRGPAPGDRLRELHGGVERGDVDRLLSKLQPSHDAGEVPGATRSIRRTLRESRPLATIINQGTSNLVYNDETGSLELKMVDGKKDIVAKNPKGDVLYSGPVNTEEERAKLTPEARALLDKIESVDGMSFKTDADFEGGDVKVLVPGARRISLPLPEANTFRTAPRPVRQPLDPLRTL